MDSNNSILPYDMSMLSFCFCRLIYIISHRPDPPLWVLGRLKHLMKFFPMKGCNTCVCKNSGKVECETKNCFCVVDNKRYELGMNIRKDCNSCVCMSNGKFTCSNKPCICKYGAVTYSIGETFSSDTCNQCRCQENGKVSNSFTVSKKGVTALNHCFLKS